MVTDFAFQDWLMPGATVFSAVIASGVAGVFSLGWKKAETEKLRSEERFSRENHNVRLFEILADGNLRMQLAAASLLIERLKEKGTVELSERRSIQRALLACLKEHDPDGPNSLNKFIAEELFPQMSAALDAAGGEQHASTSLKEYDLQGIDIRGCHFKGLHADGVDFFGAKLTSTGLRNGSFMDAVFMDADLANCKFYKAKFSEKTLFDNADIRGAIFEGCTVNGRPVDNGIFLNAIADENTKIV